MRYEELLEIVGDEPVFRSSLLKAGEVDPVDVASQLSRWVKSGKLLGLRRGVYALAEPYRARDPHPFEIANLLVKPSYVSLESALSFHGLIPEAVFTVTSVTTARPSTLETPLGRFDYRHISPDLMWGYTATAVVQADRALTFVARPEKALLDLFYLRPRSDTPEFVRQLRLDRLDELDIDRLMRDAERTGKPKLMRASRQVAELAAAYSEEWVSL